MLNIACAVDESTRAYCHGDSDPGAESLERQWFAASNAANTLKAECDILLGVLELAGSAWRRTRGQLTQLEAIRDEVERRLITLDASSQFRSRESVMACEVMSAAQR